MTEISNKESAREWMRIWEDHTDDNICDKIEGLILDGNGDFLEPPSYTWDEQSDEVSPELEMVKPKSQQLNLWICCDDCTIKVIEIKFSEHGGSRPFSRVHNAARGYHSDIPEVAAPDIIRSFMEFYLAVRERVEKFNAARRRTYDEAAIEATIDKTLVKFAAASSGPKSSLQLVPRTRKRTPAIKSEEDIYSAVAPFFKADQQVMDAAEKAINTFDAIGSPYDSVDKVMQELGRALHGYRNANAGPAAKRTRR
ncbi:hypothetical protein IWX90DRAFT_197843 [Phyllosticta citrichinensis]|uniref:Uncharacterized protein n=1 Tax=Phyllosticta citrichinensis TaxID=1130410 RepID=A0ABR1XXW6_9PEZI